ncbi:MAG: hypothetical protein RLN87_07720 [Parasphingopyxis sp.]
MKRLRPIFAVLALCCASAVGAAEAQPSGSTCPAEPNWSDNEVMELTTARRGGRRVLLAEGWVDQQFPARLQTMLDRHTDIEEIWLRSPGGDAMAGNEAGLMLRTMYSGITTRIPAGWTCAGACNFVFLGGSVRHVDPDGVFMVRMFTFSGDEALREGVTQGGGSAARASGEVEGSARQQATADVDFMIRTGISPDLLDIMYQSGNLEEGASRCLTREELRDFNVAEIRD